MRAAGEYTDRFEWLRRSLGTPDPFGQKGGALRSRGRQPGYPSQGFLWGLTADVTADRSAERESDRQETTGTVYLRGYLDVAAGDQLDDAGNGTTWTVRTALQRDNETACEVWA